MKKILLLAGLLLTSLSAETKVSVYSVPFGMVGDVSSDNFRAFEKRLAGVPSHNFTLNERDMVVSGDWITISLDNKNDSVGNFNRILAALYAYAKNTPGVDAASVKQAVAVLSIQNEAE